MFKVAVFLGLLAIAAASVMPSYMVNPMQPELNENWAEFKARYGKEYASAEHEIARRMIWEMNLRRSKSTTLNSIWVNIAITWALILLLIKHLKNSVKFWNHSRRICSRLEQLSCHPAILVTYQHQWIGGQRVTLLELRTKVNAAPAGHSVQLDLLKDNILKRPDNWYPCLNKIL